MPTSPAPGRRFTVIASGLLLGVLALVVLFTDRRTFFSPLSLTVIAAIGAAAVLLQLLFHNRERAATLHPPVWLCAVGVLLAGGAFFGENVGLSYVAVQALALLAIGTFAVSSAIILQTFRRPRN